MSSFTLAASSGSNSTISGGDTMTLVAGSGITTVNNGSGSITITATASGYANWVLAETVVHHKLLIQQIPQHLLEEQKLVLLQVLQTHLQLITTLHQEVTLQAQTL